MTRDQELDLQAKFAAKRGIVMLPARHARQFSGRRGPVNEVYLDKKLPKFRSQPKRK